MNDRPDYRRATNTAYQILEELGTFSLSTDVFAIIETLLVNCRLLTYGQACFLYGYSYQQLLDISEFGFSFLNGTAKRIILYNEALPLGSIRFTIAHEIGHAVLGHTDEDNPNFEKEANCFARNLLCPLPVAEIMDAITISDYIHLFNVTTSMAMTTLNLRSSDKYYLEPALSATIADMLDAYNHGFDSLEAFFYYLAS